MAQGKPARNRWVQMRRAAGFKSDKALETKLGVCEKSIYRWFHKGQDPALFTLRLLKQLLGVSLDTLDETIVSVREEIQQENPLNNQFGGGHPD